MNRVVIIGGGPAGYEAALVAAQLDADVTVIEAEGAGGACVLHDCVPSKTFIASSDVVTAYRDTEEFGVRSGGLEAVTWLGRIREAAPLTYQEVDGQRVEVPSAFRLEIDPRGRLGPGPWHDIGLELIDFPIRATAQVLVPTERARFGLISDIDDTIVSTHVTRKVRMLLTVALTSARTRKPFPGVASFYRALHAGVNPVFYVSKSPWNLYAPLVEYLELQRFPRGPLALRDFGLRMPKNHKTRAIEEILATYPELRFVLSGDDGEDDPEIYAAIERRFPGRIIAIYIRSRSTPDAAAAAQHAAAAGLIQASELRAVRADTASDRSSSKPALSSGALK